METITVNVDEKVAHEFRKKAEERYGRKKGHLAKAVSEAFVKWVNNEEDAVAQALKVIDKGFKAPEWRYTKRSELYEGSHRY